MKILQLNKFFYLKGGPERCMFSTLKILQNKGHKTAFFSMHHPLNNNSHWAKYFVSNIEYNKKQSIFKNVQLAFKVLYSYEAKQNIFRLIDDFKPDIAHIHNFSHQLTPSILFALKKKNIPIVMTLHDYKLVCPSYSMLNSDNEICGLCKNGKYKYCFFTKCHKQSYLKSLIAAIESYLHHKILKSYSNVDVFVSPSKFLIDKFKKMGFVYDIIYLPNFIEMNNFQQKYNINNKKITYFGRLSKEKGLFTLVDSVKGLNVELHIIGDGEIKDKLARKLKDEKISNVRLLGYLRGKSLRENIGNCLFIVVPSECYENNPLSILEAFALGKPVVGSRIGGIPELTIDGKTGYTFELGNVEDLREKILILLRDANKAIEMGKNARKFVEENNNPEKHYNELMKIYNEAINGRFNSNYL